MSTIAPSRTIELAEKIRQRILEENLEDGDLFRTEAALAEEFGASRCMTREAVSQLRELGILEGRKRLGLIVRRPDPLQLLARALPSLVNSEEDVKELAKLRYVLEVGTIELAVLWATVDQIEHLAKLARNYERAVLKEKVDLQEEKELEVAFHGYILEMSGSRLISGMQQLLIRFFAKAYSEMPSRESFQTTVWEHHAIVTAIRERDIERARVLIRLHFSGDLPLPVPKEVDRPHAG